MGLHYPTLYFRQIFWQYLMGRLPQKLKRLKLEFVNVVRSVEAYEKIKVYPSRFVVFIVHI